MFLNAGLERADRVMMRVGWFRTGKVADRLLAGAF